jgi:hypothetical protein
MSYVTLSSFFKFTNVHETDTVLQQSYIDSAENIVENYLGYSQIVTTYHQYRNGNGTNVLQLQAKPIRNIISLEIDGVPIDSNELECNDEFIMYDKLFPYGKRNIQIEYTAGWDNGDGTSGDTDFDDEFIDGGDASTEVFDDIDSGNSSDNQNTSNIPDIIKLTVLRIAALLQSESDSNIGVTSKSFADSGTRTFVNTVDYSRYLIQLSNYRLLRI